MRAHVPAVRVIAIVLTAVFLISLAAPARAEADVLLAAGLATLVIAGIILIVYLVVANTRGSQMQGRLQDDRAPVMLACAGGDPGVASLRGPGPWRCAPGIAAAGVVAAPVFVVREIVPQS